MSASSRSIAMVVTLLLGVADLIVLDVYLAPAVLGQDDDEAEDRTTAIARRTPTTNTPRTAVNPTPATRRPTPMPPVAPGRDAGPAPGRDAGVEDLSRESDAAVAVPDAGAIEPPVDAAPPADAARAIRQPVEGFEPLEVTLYFAQDRATIKPHHEQDMDRGVEHLRAYPGSVAVIEGHADDSEDRYGVNALIKRRIRKIEKYLLANAIAPERIRTINRGSSAGASESATSGNRWARLRVELP